MDSKRQYYYLVAGLPDLVLDQSKRPFTLSAFRQELKTHLHPDDYQLIEFFFLPADNYNLFHLLKKTEFAWDENGRFTADELTEALREPDALPEYMQRFIAAYQAQEPIFPNMIWRNQLTWLYCDYVLESTKGFMYELYTFERDLRNLLTGLAVRRNKLSLEGQLIGDYPLTAAIRSSHARDFGLSGEYPYIERLLQWEDNNWLERELALDAMRWNNIDQCNTFNYFTVEVLLGYLIKLMILERWSPLDKVDGEAAFRQLVGNLENSVQFTSEFALS
jgi:hypothetical protein